MSERMVLMQDSKRIGLWMLVWGLLILAVGVGIGIAVSGGEQDETDRTTRTTETVVVETPESAEPTAPTASEKPDTGYTTPPPANGDTGEDGRHFTYIREVATMDETTLLVVDFAQMLTGDEAAAAAGAAGEESPPPNDYFIVNENALVRACRVDTTMNVSLTSSSTGVQPEGYEVAFSVWQDMFTGVTADAAFLRDVPYWVTIEGGVITAIEEQYLP